MRLPWGGGGAHEQEDTTIGFDDLAPNVVVTDRCAGQRVVFDPLPGGAGDCASSTGPVSKSVSRHEEIDDDPPLGLRQQRRPPAGHRRPIVFFTAAGNLPMELSGDDRYVYCPHWTGDSRRLATVLDHDMRNSHMGELRGRCQNH